ncbi:MAG: M24 family metallopeptidase [Acidobacteria bacterium]|nr:M24 family metallopeptidase [Acidobacteriota bacterium]
MDAGTIELLRGLGMEIATSANLVQLFEARWTAEQLEMHVAAGRLIDSIRRAAFGRIADCLRGGVPVNEFDIKQFILESFDRAGLETDHGPIVAANANCSNPHYEPGPEDHCEIRRGDWVLLDMWAKFRKPDAVYYDITWTGYCGPDVPAEMQKVFDVVTGARDAAIDRVRQAFDAGRELHGWEVDDSARGYIQERGYGDFFIHRTGHSIGADVHGAGVNIDNLETHDERTLIPGVCFSIEPGVYLPAFGVRSEVDVFMSEWGPMVTGEKQTRPVLIL